MARIVYNACYGGFSLSPAAILRAREISNDSAWGGPCIVGDIFEDGTTLDHNYGYIENVPRYDPILVQVVKELGPAANGQSANLRIAEIPSGSKFRIDEYDGCEVVVTPDDYEWEIAP